MNEKFCPAMDIDLLYEILDVPRHWSAYGLMRGARRVHGYLAPLVLSVAEQDGARLGPVAREELRHARRRAARYDELAALVTADPGARVVKGPALAARYPDGILRPQGDLDVVVTDETTLWRTARRVRSARPDAEAALSLLYDGERRHLLVTLHWPAEDPLAEPPNKVEICTFAFPGRVPDVPLRDRLPEREDIANLLVLAEERFQRPLNAKDALDLAVLLGSSPPDLAVAAATAAGDLCLAPELIELVDLTRRILPRVPVDPGPDLAASAAAEAARRRAVSDQGASCFGGRPPGDVGGLRAVLQTGSPVHGMPLDDGQGENVTGEIEFRDGPWGTMLRSPVGDFLLVAGEIVESDRFEAARRARASAFSPS